MHGLNACHAASLEKGFQAFVLECLDHAALYRVTTHASTSLHGDFTTNDSPIRLHWRERDARLFQYPRFNFDMSHTQQVQRAADVVLLTHALGRMILYLRGDTGGRFVHSHSVAKLRRKACNVRWAIQQRLPLHYGPALIPQGVPMLRYGLRIRFSNLYSGYNLSHEHNLVEAQSSPPTS
jgi:hypothetical protein